MARVVHLRNIKRALQLATQTEASRQPVKYVIGGRVSNFRNYKSFNFIDLIDGSTNEHLQIIIKKNVLSKPELGSYLICRGEIAQSPGAQQGIEFKVDQLDYVGQCNPEDYPLVTTSKSQIRDAWFRRNLHLRPRASHFASLLRVRSELEMSMHMIFRQMDFFKVHTPILTSNDSEASSDLFMIHRSKHISNPTNSSSNNNSSQYNDVIDERNASDGDKFDDEHSDVETQSESDPAGGGAQVLGVDRHLKGGYFRDKDVFMITSAQLHLESLAASLSRVYCLAPAFRAESTLSQRHLCEFTMLEAEEANLASLEPLMDRVETVLKFCLEYLAEVSEFKADFASLIQRYSNEKIYDTLAHSRYIRMTYDEAVAILQQKANSGALPAHQCRHGDDLNRKHERVLLEHCNNVPIFLTNYPKSLKPFYMKTCDSQPDKVANFDLIAPFGGEICGGSLREDNLEMLRKNLDNNSEFGMKESGGGGGGGGGRRWLQSAPDGGVKSGVGGHNLEERQQDERRAARDQFRHPFSWYLDLREFGSFPHGGFGIGVERLIQSMLGINNIKDATAFPRWPGNCSM